MKSYVSLNASLSIISSIKMLPGKISMKEKAPKSFLMLRMVIIVASLVMDKLVQTQLIPR